MNGNNSNYTQTAQESQYPVIDALIEAHRKIRGIKQSLATSTTSALSQMVEVYLTQVYHLEKRDLPAFWSAVDAGFSAGQAMDSAVEAGESRDHLSTNRAIQEGMTWIR